MLIACFYYAIMGAFVKVLASTLPSIEIVFFRNAFGLIFVYFLLKKEKGKSKGGRPILLALRGIVGVIALMAFFYNIAHISLSEAFVFQKTAPIFTALLSFFILKEKLSKIGWFAVFIGFIGIILVIQPNLGLNIYDFYGILSGFGAALAFTMVRELKNYYSPSMIVMSFMLSASIMSFICMILGSYFQIPFMDFLLSPFVMPSLKAWIFAFIIAVLGFYYQIYLTKSLAVAKKAGLVVSVAYSDIIFTIILGLFLGDSLPNIIAICGISLIIVSGILAGKK